MYQKIVLKEFPNITFAHKFHSSRCEFHFPKTSDRLEISYTLEGEICQLFSENDFLRYPSNQFILLSGERPFTIRSDNPCAHITVGFQCSYERTTLTHQEFIKDICVSTNSSPCFYLPTTGLSLDSGSPAEITLRKLIASRTITNVSQHLHCIALLYELLAALTEETKRVALLTDSPLSLAAQRYIPLACEYIVEHLSEKISVQQIASQLHISTGYLSVLFREYTGKTIVEYINTTRLERIKELMLSKRLSLREAGFCVGIYDENYLSRMFKKHFGISARNFIRLNKSFTP